MPTAGHAAARLFLTSLCSTKPFSSPVTNPTRCCWRIAACHQWTWSKGATISGQICEPNTWMRKYPACGSNPPHQVTRSIPVAPRANQRASSATPAAIAWRWLPAFPTSTAANPVRPTFPPATSAGWWVTATSFMAHSLAAWQRSCTRACPPKALTTSPTAASGGAWWKNTTSASCSARPRPSACSRSRIRNTSRNTISPAFAPCSSLASRSTNLLRSGFTKG